MIQYARETVMCSDPRALRLSLLPVFVLAAVLLLPGCGGGGGAAPPAAVAAAGSLTITVRDAEGDFLSYAVDVTSLRLERANGDVVETLPRSTRIDFAELVELTEFLSSATVPAGVYTRVVVGLDFSAADIIVQDETGAPRTATAVDERGMPLGRLDVRIELPTPEPIRIVAGTAAFVTLDFDLGLRTKWSGAPRRPGSRWRRS
jgi:hypothetical protein